MRAGKLDKLITFERLRGNRNDFGNEKRSKSQWTTLATCYARLQPLSGREYFAAQQVQSETSFRITVRYQSELEGLSPKDRIRYGSRLFDIRSVLNIDERNVELQIICTENLSFQE